MCWGVPARVLEIRDFMAKVEFGGTQKEVFIIHDDIKPGDLVIVHAGSIIGKIDPREISKTLELYSEILRETLLRDGVDPEEVDKIVEKWMAELIGEEHG